MDGISRLTAMIITTNDDLVYSHAGPAENGKYAGWISKANGRPILSTEPVFDTAELAIQHMTDLREELTDILEKEVEEAENSENKD